MRVIPKQLCNPDFRFLPIGKISLVDGKKKIGGLQAEWQKNNYAFDTLPRCNNLGIIAGYGGLILVDIDIPELLDELQCPVTFTTKSGGKKLPHYYFILTEPIDNALLFYNGQRAGEIRAKNQFCICPPSRIEGGNAYEVWADEPIVKLSKEEFLKIFGKYIREKSEEVVQANITRDESRSGKEFGELMRLLKKGYPKEKIFGMMMAFSKWKEQGEAYREHTYKNAVERFDANQKSSENKYIQRTKKGKLVYLIEDIASDLRRNTASFVTIYGKRGEEVWAYNNETGLWEANAREIIKTEVESMLGEHARSWVVTEVFEKIKRQTAIAREDFEKTPEHLLCVRNGILNVKTKELEPFSPKHYFKTRLNITYEPNADCPNIKKFFDESLYEEDIAIVQEWFGFHLYKRYFLKKVLLAFGEKDTGKSRFLDLLTAFVGDENKTGIPLHEISRGERFCLAFLKDKLANIYDDLKQGDINDTGGLKVATGGSNITAELKFGDVFQFIPYAKNTFSANKIPEIREKDMAYYDRFLPIAFDNVVPKNEQDPFLLDKLTTDEELSGLLNWALEGLKRLIENRRFSLNKTAEEIMHIMEKHSNGLSAFCNDCLMPCEGGKISKNEMAELYKAYSGNKGLQFISKSKIGRDLQKYAPYILSGRDNDRFWLNVKVQDNAPKEVFTTHKTLSENPYACKREVNRTLVDMPFEEASYPSPKDTSDTFNEKDMEKIEL